MPRDSNGVWTDLPNLTAVAGEPIESADWNNYRADLAQNEFNAARPISAGGTSATNAASARANLGLALYDQTVALSPAQQSQFRANIGTDSVSGFRNPFHNGYLDIWDRGPGPFATSGYTANNFRLRIGVGESCRVVKGFFQPGQEEVPGNPNHYLSWERSVAGSTPSVLEVYSEDAKTFSGKTVTVTFWARASVSTTVNLDMVQNFGTGGTPSAESDTLDTLHSVTTFWSKISSVIALPSTSGKTLGTDSGSSYISARIIRPHNSINAGATVEIANFSVVEGDASFEMNPPGRRDISHEMVSAQRTLIRLGGEGSGDNRIMVGEALSSTTFRLLPFPSVSMVRSPLSLVVVGSSSFTNSSGSPLAVTSLTLGTASTARNITINGAVSSGLVAGNIGSLLTTAGSYILISAEY